MTLIRAVKKKDIKLVNSLLKSGVNPDMRNSNNSTPLHFAVKREMYTLVYRLIRLKVDVNVRDNQGFTPLLLAYYMYEDEWSEENYNLIKKLLQAGAEFGNEDIDRFIEDDDEQLEILLSELNGESSPKIKHSIKNIHKMYKDRLEYRREATDKANQKYISELLDKSVNGSNEHMETLMDKIVKYGDVAILPLMEGLDHEAWDVREVAAVTLGKLNAVAAEEKLMLCSRDTREEVRWAAYWALGETRSEKSAQLMAAALNGPYPQDYIVIAKALGKIKSEESVKPLINCLSADNEKLQTVALQSLKSITGKDFGRSREEWISWLDSGATVE